MTSLQQYCNFYAALLQLLYSDAATIVQCYCNTFAVPLQKACSSLQ